jgi:hypothetical protein
MNTPTLYFIADPRLVTAGEALAFVRKHGVVLASAKGPAHA